jgi:hypothetical protein
MTTGTRSAVAMLTDFCASDAIAAAARRTGFVKRTSQLTGTLFLALVTFGAWSDATTTLAPLAAKVTPLDEQVEVSPAAIHQRMNPRALAFLQDRLRPALAQVQAVDHVCNAGLFTAFPKVYLAESTGFALPDRLPELCPGSGGSAATAGAQLQAVWDYKNRVCGHLALPPWTMPEQRDVDTAVALAHQGVRFLFDFGYVKIKACACIAAAGAYFFSRLHHHTTLWHTASGQGQPLALASWRTTVAGDSPEPAIFLGAKEPVACRLVASRLPEGIVNERRRRANKKAKKQGYPPSQAPLAL